MSVVIAPAAAPAVATLEAVRLSHWYSPSRGLQTVSFSASAPGTLAVTGANGSGKSTMLRAFAGLLRPSGGAANLSVGGMPLPMKRRRHAVGYASPDLMFYDELSVAENLTFAAESLGLTERGAAVQHALQVVGLERRAGDRVAALSSGMRQRLRLALALLHRPPVLLLDEPGSHLDDEGTALVRRIVEQHGRVGLVLIATNDEREWRLAERRIELRGRGLGDPA